MIGRAIHHPRVMSAERIALLGLGLLLAGCQRDDSFPDPPAKDPSTPSKTEATVKEDGGKLKKGDDLAKRSFAGQTSGLK